MEKVTNVTCTPSLFDDTQKSEYVPSHLIRTIMDPLNCQSAPATMYSTEPFYHYCQYCKISFEKRHDYDQHIVEIHAQRIEKKILTCDLCSTSFKRHDHLKRHIKSIHDSQKICICPVCNKDFNRQDSLLKHVRKKHVSLPETFHCRACEYHCNSLKELIRHEDTHSLTERHVCEHCNASFRRRDHMLRHVKSQHLNQSVICPVCNQSYKRKDHVVRHVREKHNMEYLKGKLVTSPDNI